MSDLVSLAPRLFQLGF